MLKPNDLIYDQKNQEYKIVKPIGSGGMGYVLLIERTNDGEHFALKTLGHYISEDSAYQALINEGTLAESIQHVNAINYIYFHDGQSHPHLPPYIIMELADESSLNSFIEERINNNSLLVQEELIILYSNLIDGMEAINEVLVHRDIKPSNILFKDNQLKISDFGISKVAGDPTRSKSFKGSGTIAYMSPEALLNQENSIQMDIYSMGIIFYLLATLKHPYESDGTIVSADEWRNAHLYKLPNFDSALNPQISPKIFSIIQKMMEKNKNKRFYAWAEIRKELNGVNEINKSTHSETIEKIIEKRLERKTQDQKIEIEKKKEQEAKEQKKAMILYQFDNDIITPLKSFINDYNRVNKNIEDQMQIKEIDSKNYPEEHKKILITSGNPNTDLQISLRCLDENDYFKPQERYQMSDFHSQRQHNSLRIEPKINRKKILAWGVIENRFVGKGFNIILAESETSAYGDWIIMKNKISGFARETDNRPEPFAFDLKEIIKEINSINSIGVYNNQILSFSFQEITNFISDL